MNYKYKKYKKHIYWLDEKDFKKFVSKTKELSLSPFNSRKAVCVPLSKRIELSFISPQIFRENPICRRQLSWYDKSPYKDRYLVVSPKDVFKDLNFKINPISHIVLRETDFKPDTLCNEESLEKLVNDPEYQKQKPEKWEEIDKDDEFQKRWLKIIGLRKITFSELFVYHCANHANFINPKFYIVENSKKIPYSIAPTRYICSCCLEVYDIIGYTFQKKLVVPCPGAVIFAGLKQNRYYEVIKLK